MSERYEVRRVADRYGVWDAEAGRFEDTVEHEWVLSLADASQLADDLNRLENDERVPARRDDESRKADERAPGYDRQQQPVAELCDLLARYEWNLPSDIIDDVYAWAQRWRVNPDTVPVGYLAETP